MDRPNADLLARTIERVRKLLAIAQDDRANPNEAAAAAHQAEVVMRRFQIDHADVVASEMRHADSFDSVDVGVVMKRGQGHRPSKTPPWAQWLAIAIGKLNDCQVRIAYNDDLGACLRFSGYKPDVLVSQWTFDFLVNTMIGAVRRYQKDSPRSKQESESFRRGFVLALTSKLRAQLDEKKAEMAQASSSRAMILVKTQAVSDRFGVVSYGNAKNVAVSRGDAFAHGREEGRKVDTRRGALGGGSTSSALRLG